MAYVRGHERCYAKWAAEAGDNWSYRALMPLFRRVERNSRGASDWHGGAGPLYVSDTPGPHAGHLAFLEASRARGFDARPDFDFDGPRQENGAGFYQKNIKDGRRHSAAAAFLAPVLTRPNLTVWSKTHATEILIQGHRAVGLRAIREGSAVEARAAREVIVSAGAIETPKLLMLSGIGPADDLKRLGIPVRLDQKSVGANLQDHLRVSVRWHARQPLAPSPVSAGLFTYSTSANARRTYAAPDIQFYVGRGVDTPDPFVTLTVAMTQPESAGRISLRSADPRTPPVIHANYLQAASDLDAMVEGVRLAQALATSKPYDAIRGEAADPDASVDTDAEIRAFVRRAGDTIFHPAGTCRMGGSSAAVVDPQLRVRGIDGLRIADASIFPAQLNSQIHAACVVIGEKAAEMIHD